MHGRAPDGGPSLRASSIAPVRRALEWAHAPTLLALPGVLRAEGRLRRRRSRHDLGLTWWIVARPLASHLIQRERPFGVEQGGEVVELHDDGKHSGRSTRPVRRASSPCFGQVHLGRGPDDLTKRATYDNSALIK